MGGLGWAGLGRDELGGSNSPSLLTPQQPAMPPCHPAQPPALAFLLPYPACLPAGLQGCGKTTLCEQLESLFAYTGATAASISIDDFYHTYEGQQAGGWWAGWLAGCNREAAWAPAAWAGN